MNPVAGGSGSRIAKQLYRFSAGTKPAHRDYPFIAQSCINEDKLMKTLHLVASLVTATAIGFASPAFTADDAQEFVNKAAIGGMFEVDSSTIAQDKVTDQSVKDFAKKMVDDHGAANAKLESIAGEQKLKVPSELDAQHKAELDKLQQAKAPLDQPYVEMQRNAHTDAVGLFEAYAKDGDNATLKSFAQETLPTLKMHNGHDRKDRDHDGRRVGDEFNNAVCHCRG
nr:DUF4142 domain-containing protein [Mesorhizobium sp. AR10]